LNDNIFKLKENNKSKVIWLILMKDLFFKHSFILMTNWILKQTIIIIQIQRKIRVNLSKFKKIIIVDWLNF